MPINRRALLASLAAMVVIPPRSAFAVEPVRLWGPVYRSEKRVYPWYHFSHLKRWHLARWHYDETKDGVPVFRHCDSGLTYLAVETLFSDEVFAAGWFPIALQEIRPASGLPWRAGVSAEDVVEIGNMAATIAWSVGIETARIRQVFKAAYWDYRLHNPRLVAPRLIVGVPDFTDDKTAVHLSEVAIRRKLGLPPPSPEQTLC